MEKLLRYERILEINRITEQMEEKEEHLWFFENEEKIDLAIERNEAILKAKPEQKKAKKIKPEDEEYIPPQAKRRLD